MTTIHCGATADLMKKFYSHLTEGKLDKAESLRQAKLDMLREGRWTNPYHWAPLTKPSLLTFTAIGKTLTGASDSTSTTQTTRLARLNDSPMPLPLPLPSVIDVAEGLQHDLHHRT